MLWLWLPSRLGLVNILSSCRRLTKMEGKDSPIWRVAVMFLTTCILKVLFNNILWHYLFCDAENIDDDLLNSFSS